MTTKTKNRKEILSEIERLSEIAIFGTPSETYRKCGNKSCRCHGSGPKHGPHLHISYRGPDGKTAGYYVPKAAHRAIRDGVEAWQSIQKHLKALSEMNRQQILSEARRKKAK